MSAVKGPRDRLKKAGFTVAGKEMVILLPEDLILVTDKASAIYDPRVDWPLDLNFVTDVAVNGVMEPIKIAINGNDEEGKPRPEVVVGRQRVKSARWINAFRRGDVAISDAFPNATPEEQAELQAALTSSPADVKIACVVTSGDDRRLIREMIAENEGRQPETIASRAAKFESAVRFGFTEIDLAKMARVSIETVDHHFAFLKLIPELQAWVIECNPKARIAGALATCPKERQAALHTLIVEANPRTAKNVEAFVLAFVKGKPLSKGEKPKPESKVETADGGTAHESREESEPKEVTGEEGTSKAERKKATEKLEEPKGPRYPNGVLRQEIIAEWADELSEEPDENVNACMIRDVLAFILCDDAASSVAEWQGNLLPKWARDLVKAPESED